MHNAFTKTLWGTVNHVLKIPISLYSRRPASTDDCALRIPNGDFEETIKGPTIKLGTVKFDADIVCVWSGISNSII